MPGWPATLPQSPLAEGFEDLAPGGNLLVHQPDAGPPEVRRRSTAAHRPIAAQYRMDSVQVATFEAFVADDLAAGALAFGWPHPRLGLIVVRFAVEDRSPRYQIRPRHRGMRYTVSLWLWRLPA